MYDLPMPTPEHKAAAPHRDAPPGWRLLAPNLMLFQVGWFAAVLGADNGFEWLGPVVISFVLMIHLARAKQPGKEAALIALALTIGLAFESVLAASAWVAYPGHPSTLAPLWMVALWANFATTLNVALRNLRTRTWLLVLLGGIGGPLAYWGGANLGTIQWLESVPVLIYLALGWAVLTPILAQIALKLDGYQHGN